MSTKQIQNLAVKLQVGKVLQRAGKVQQDLLLDMVLQVGKVLQRALHLDKVPEEVLQQGMPEVELQLGMVPQQVEQQDTVRKSKEN